MASMKQSGKTALKWGVIGLLLATSGIARETSAVIQSPNPGNRMKIAAGTLLAPEKLPWVMATAGVLYVNRHSFGL